MVTCRRKQAGRFLEESRTILHGTSMTYGVVAIHYQGDDKSNPSAGLSLGSTSPCRTSPRLGRVVGLSANKECQVQSPKVGEEDGILEYSGRGEGGGRRIKLDIGNIKYKCNLPRFMFTVGERKREREGRVREGAEGMRSPRGVAGTTRRAGPARGSWGALPSTFLSCFTSTLFLTPLFFFLSSPLAWDGNFLR